MNEPRASRYHRLRRRSAVAATGLVAGVLAALLTAGWSVRLRDLTDGSAAAYALVLGLVLEAAVLPLEWHRTHRLERQYGLATLSGGEWLIDHLKGSALLLAVGVAGAASVYRLMWMWPTWWWLGAAAGGAIVAALVTALAPVLILPLFHRSRPLERETLHQRLLDLSRRAGIRVLGVHEWRVGDQTRRASAALVGSGSTRRILLSAPLLADYSDEEIEVVLAHEMAHHVHRDILKGLAAQSAVLLGGLAAAAAALHLLWESLALSSPADVAGMPLMLLTMGGVSLLSAPALHALSRRCERRADEFALHLVSRPETFVGVMRRLAAQNLVEEHPSKAALWLFHSHPPVEERIRAARGDRAVDREPMATS